MTIFDCTDCSKTRAVRIREATDGSISILVRGGSISILVRLKLTTLSIGVNIASWKYLQSSGYNWLFGQ
jgi:hypothetical protein